MKLILSGGGIGEKCHTSYKKFAEELKERKVLFVPFANDEMTYQEALEWFKGQVNPYGINNIIMIENPQELTKELLKSVGGVYVSGGNTFQLLKELKSCNAFNVMKEFLNEDSIIMGGSAGATVFGKSIDTCLMDDLKIIASDKNNVGLKETDGFNAVCGYSFFVHYRVKERQYEDTEKRVQRLLSDGHNLICLPEETSLYIEHGRMSIIGTLPAEIITKTTRFQIKPNEQLNNKVMGE